MYPIERTFFLDKDIFDNSEILLQLKQKLGKDWRKLGRILSVSDNELDAIHEDWEDEGLEDEGLEEMAHRMFYAWKTQQKLPTLNALANAIYKINRIDLITVMEKFTSKNFFL